MRAWKAFLSVSLVLILVVIASLIGVGGASLFIYRQMTKEVTVTKAAQKTPGAAASANAGGQPGATAPPTLDANASHAVIPAVADSTEWHFAEFSDQPRYIDVTYDGGKQHARLKVNTVLSPELDAPSSSVGNADNADDGDSSFPLSDPGSHYILDKNTGRVVGIDGSAGAAMEVRRAQAAPPTNATPTIRNPVPEVRVATPVLQYGRPLFDGDRPVQAAVPASNYLPTRRALPVGPDDPTGSTSSFNASTELTDDGQPVRRAAPVYRPQNIPQNDRSFQLPDNTSVFPRR